MSKIIEALEKARSEGTLEAVPTTVSERDTLLPAGSTHSVGAVRKRKRRNGSPLAMSSTLDAGVLRDVDPHLETLHKPMSVVSEQYRALRNRLERSNFSADLRCIAVTSSVKGEGKSLTATNLAVVLAQDATKDILLVDADLRRPKVSRLLGLDAAPGLADHLEGDHTLDEVIRHTPFFGLDVVTAGEVRGHPAEVLASPELTEFVRQCKARYDYVIFDTPPLHPISDVNFLADTVDGVLLVVRAGKTSKGVLKQAVANLPEGKLIGTLLNRAESLSRGYGYGKGGYYYKYY